MTIHRAKNREFPNVIVLWPHTATGSAEHLRRLLYNSITRAQKHCTVVVLGQGRLASPPFAPST
ncbi:MAG TPA: ATP-binding domain-containing protein [Rhodothermales bacterium]|nr:ATP-binding domain-containing protein [Rhodothermales bacterium]